MYPPDIFDVSTLNISPAKEHNKLNDYVIDLPVSFYRHATTQTCKVQNIHTVIRSELATICIYMYNLSRSRRNVHSFLRY